tara:strand:+ start:199 stop:645 length:447 start_codon:yes stop_codon:yes gene_type:complete
LVILLQIFLGLAISNFYDWFLHRYLLHGLGKEKISFWNFHWKEHHKTCRKNENQDFKFYSKEVMSLQLFFIFHAIFLWDYPVILSAMGLYAVSYYIVHRYAHHNPSWCKKYLRWHHDHHMGRDQDKNWCVLLPFADYIFGTREKMVDK